MNRGFLSHVNFYLLAPVLALVIISLTVIFSVSSSLFWSQMLFVFISLVAFFLCTNINYKILRLWGTPIYIFSLVVLALLLFLGIESRGAVRWFELFGFRIQFSEFIKPFLAISLAAYLSEQKPKLTAFLKIFAYLFPIAFLIFLQPDLGNALIYLFVVVLALLVFGFPLKFFASGLIFVIAASPVIWNFLHDYQKQRLLTFINPSLDPLGTSYNAIQSIIAVGSGMFFGRGLGQGTQSALRFLPERHTDFIFATIAEELGLIGALGILIIFSILFYRIFLIFMRLENTFSKIFALICFFILFSQFFVNVGMNVGLTPVVGVTLPFVSYGGSSLLSSFILLGLLSAVDKGESKDKKVLEIR
ncbi:MAG: rod shape-determining protein RodA [Candidatus Levybacteria bacterium]|nr:rod shape-determining protein RodA [Candidatus Levybacteria bacterium]